MQLFVDRAQMARADFQVTIQNAPAIAALCHQLEGIPLAIELAAAWARVLAPVRMLAQLDRRFEFLVGRKRDVSGRHFTLRAAVDWSYQLLSPELQQFFCRLCVFRGGWTLAAAAAVCEEPRARDLLCRLRESSLVQVEMKGDSTRYRMLETMREYAAEQLSPGERGAAERRHGQYYLELTEALEPNIRETETLELLRADVDNLRAALTWSHGPEKHPELCLRLAGALQHFWARLSLAAEGRRWIEEMLPARGDLPPQVRARALSAGAFLAHHLGDYLQAAVWGTKCLELYRRLEDPRHVVDALAFVGELALTEGDFSRAEALLHEGLALCPTAGNDEAHAFILCSLAHLALRRGNADRAIALFEQGLTYFRRAGFRLNLNGPLGELGYLHLRQGDHPRATALFEEQLALGRGAEDRSVIARALWHLGLAAIYVGDYEEARRLTEEALASFRAQERKTCIADALGSLGTISERTEHFREAREFHEQALAIRREMQDRWMIAISLDRLGWVALMQGEEARASSLLQESLLLFQEIGERRGMASSLISRGRLAVKQRDYETAAALFKDSLNIRHELGDRPGIAQCFEALAALHASQAREIRSSAGRGAERAAWLSGAAETLREAIGAPLPPAERADYARYVADTRAPLGDASWALLWAQGREMPLGQAIELALQEALSA